MAMNTFTPNPIDSVTGASPALGKPGPAKRRARRLTASDIAGSSATGDQTPAPDTCLIDRMVDYRNWWNVPKAKPSRRAAHRT